jgi:LacI family transcriptional regulator
LIERIAGKSSANARPGGRRRVVSPRLIVRESTATWAGAGKRHLAA